MPKPPPQPDRPRIGINLQGEFDAHELEDIIRDLAQARAGLTPAVPLDPPDHATPGDALEQSAAAFTIATTASGGLRIWLRSEGVGWQSFILDASARETLADFLRQQIGHTHTSH